MRKMLIAGLCCIALSSGTAWATGPGGGSGGGAGAGGGSGGGGQSGESNACPFPMGPALYAAYRGPDFCLMTATTPVLLVGGSSAGLIPWTGNYPSDEHSAPVPVFWGNGLAVE